MCVSTSIYITKENFKALEIQRDSCGMSINKIVSRLLKKALDKKRIKPRLFKSVEYQKKMYETQKFKTIHVDLDNKLYEQCLDLRKVLKMSVSLILALSISENLENFFADDSSTDNYVQKYILICLGNDSFVGYLAFSYPLPP